MRKIILFFIVLLFLTGFDIVNPNQKYTYEQMVHDLKKVHKTYPKITELRKIGHTMFNRNIWAIKLGTGNHYILINASHHAREWMTTNLVMEMLDVYAAAYANGNDIYGYNSSILNDVSIWFVPMVNPDGVTLQQRGLTAFPQKYHKRLIAMNKGSTNFERWKANAVGIDLNRQYPAGWNEIVGDIPEPFYKLYKGKKPLEAKEIKSLVAFTKEINPEITVAYHSTGRVLYWSFGNYDDYIVRDLRIAKKISKATNYELAKPIKTAVGGGYTDWFIKEFNKPGFTPEISYPINEGSPPLSIFDEVWQRNQAVGLLLAEEGKEIAKYEDYISPLDRFLNIFRD